MLWHPVFSYHKTKQRKIRKMAIKWNLLNLLNEVRKSDKISGLPGILSLFPNKLNKYNNTGAQMFDSIYHMTIKLL